MRSTFPRTWRAGQRCRSAVQPHLCPFHTASAATQLTIATATHPNRNRRNTTHPVHSKHRPGQALPPLRRSTSGTRHLRSRDNAAPASVQKGARVWGCPSSTSFGGLPGSYATPQLAGPPHANPTTATETHSAPTVSCVGYSYKRQRPMRTSASRSGSLTISMWQVSISMSVCTPPSAAMHSC